MRQVLYILLLINTLCLGKELNIDDINKGIPDLKEFKKIKPIFDVNKFNKQEDNTTNINNNAIFIKDFQIKGNVVFEISTLKKLYIDSINKNLTFNEINEIVNRITNFYRENGYFLAKAIIPKQNIFDNNHIIKIYISEGEYGKFIIDTQDEDIKKNVSEILESFKNKKISLTSLENRIIKINNLNGIEVTNVKLKAGELYGTSDLVITVEKNKPLDYYLITDNYGNTFTGKYRLMMGLNFNSIFNIGDRFSVFGLLSNGSNLENYKLSYETPLLNDKLISKISFSKTDYKLTNIDKIDDFKGNSELIETKFTYPIFNEKNKKTNFSFLLENKNLIDYQNSSYLNNKKSKSIKFGFDYLNKYIFFDKYTLTELDLSWKYGKLDNKILDSKDYYSKINLNLSHTTDMSSFISFKTNFKSQYNLKNKNLDSSEDFSIGGINGVSLYPDGELNAENGYIATLESIFRIPTYKGINNSISLFYDTGKAYMTNKSEDITFESRRLQDIGIKFNTDYKEFFSRLNISWKIDNEEITSDKDENYKISYQMGFVF